MTLSDLDTQFTNGEVRQFQGRGGQTFDYIEDETVMDRLDEVLGKGEWSVEVEPISVADGIVKVSLIAFGRRFEDFGYANNLQGDALKEAVSDGIRRCGRYLGVGRYLYKKHVSVSPQGTGRAGPSSPARPAAPPRSSTSVPDEPDGLMDPDLDVRTYRQQAAVMSAQPAVQSGKGWTFGDLAKAAEAAGIPKNTIYATADQLFGPKTKVTDLTGQQREQIAFEMGLVA